MFRSLKITLLLSHTGIILLTNLLLAYVSYFYLISTLENSQKQNLEFITRHAVQTINISLTTKVDLLERISGGQEVVNYSINYREAALSSYLADFQGNFSTLSFINEQGIEELRVTDGEIAQDAADYSGTPFFTKSLAHPNTVIIFTDDGPMPRPKEPVLHLAIARHQYFEDRFAGLLLATLPYREIAESLADIRFSATGYLLLVDRTGNIITISRPSSGASAGQISISRTEAEKPSAAFSAPRQPDRVPAFQRTTVRGRDSLVAAAFIPELQWTVMTVLPHEEFMQQVKQLRIGFIILFVIFFALASFLAYLLANGITMPLARLTRAAKAISQGNLSQIIDIKSQDEIGKLIGSFNTMTRNLQETTISRDYFNTILSSMQESLIVLGPDGRIETINNSTMALLGYEKHELTGKPLAFILKKEEADACPFSNLEEGEILRECELIYLTKWGRGIPVHFSASPMKNGKGEIYGIVCLAINISRRKKMETALRQSEAKLREIAITDELTSLLNRRGFMTMATKQLQVAKRQEGNVFLMYADVDNLKWVNDHLGHHAGDQVLMETADLLRSTFRDSDTIARLGGDEFAVLLIDPADQKSVMHRLEMNMRARNSMGQRSYELSMSIGVARFDPEHPSTLEELMNRADNLMYECKQQKKQGAR